ncbi:hypothetical protein ACTVJH_14895 [Desulfoplanes sp. PS50]|jgi:F0F1-type ATP synthase assembly protein I
MNGSINTPPHVKLSQNKAEWDAKQKAKQKAQAENTQYVIVTEIDIPFSKLVGFLVKLAIAAVPAGIIVFIFWSILAGLLVNLMR